MSLMDNIRQTIGDAAGNVVERGQNFSEQARLQVALKKLQLERARRLHDLGARTFDWYRSGALTVSGPVPPEVTDLCAQIDTLKVQVEETQLQLDEARRQAEQMGASSTPPTPSVAAPPTTPPPVTPAPDPPAAPPRQTSPLPPTSPGDI